MSGATQAAKITLQVEGMDCAACATKIKAALERIDGISDVTASVPRRTVTMTMTARRLTAGYAIESPILATAWPGRTRSETIPLETIRATGSA